MKGRRKLWVVDGRTLLFPAGEEQFTAFQKFAIIPRRLRDTGKFIVGWYWGLYHLEMAALPTETHWRKLDNFSTEEAAREYAMNEA